MASTTTHPTRARAIHPVHAVLIAGTIPLFLGALLSDWAYSASYQIQWTNFASWLTVGALVFAGFALLWAVVDALRRRGGWVYFVLVLLTFATGLLSALVHSKDAWGAMPEGFILSGVALLLALAANWAGFSGWRTGEAR
ncbi:MAG: DUF2231 domain-containing protein [Allosphingosinicella sp.]